MATTAEKLSGQVSNDVASLPRVFGRYVLLDRIAVGGMAEVFVARPIDPKLPSHCGVFVAVKRVLPALADSPAFVDMLAREARIASELDHPHIARMFAFDRENTEYFLVMEHVVGADVRTLVRAARNGEHGEIPLGCALRLLIDVCDGLAYAHAKCDATGAPLGIVHRDISPQNVVVSAEGVAKIVDFGIATCLLSGSPEITRSGQLKGKLPYMSPEQARGEVLDHRTDLFATGVMLFEMTTGRRLFKASSDFETLRRICELPYPTPSSVRPDYDLELEAIVMRAIARDRHERYSSAGLLREDLEAFAHRQGIDISRESFRAWVRTVLGSRLAGDEVRLHERLHAFGVRIGAPECVELFEDRASLPSMSTVRPVIRDVRDVTDEPVNEVRSSHVAKRAVVVGMIATALAAGVALGIKAAPTSLHAARVSSLSHIVAVPTAGTLLLSYPGVRPAAVFLDGKATPKGDVLELAPDTNHRVVVLFADGHSQARELSMVAGELREMEVAPQVIRLR